MGASDDVLALRLEFKLESLLDKEVELFICFLRLAKLALCGSPNINDGDFAEEGHFKKNHKHPSPTSPFESIHSNLS